MEILKDCRAINDDLLEQLINGGFKEFKEFVKKTEKSEDKLALCFRGNSNPESVVIYYNNHYVWKLYIRNSKLSVEISFNHARYSKDWKEKYDILCNKYNFKKKENIYNKENEVDIKKLTASIPLDNEFNKEFVEGTFNIILPLMKDYFNQDLEYDYFKMKNIKHKNYLEKIKQHELYFRYNNLDNGICIYDLEFAQPMMKNKEDNNQPDMLGLEFEHGKPKKLLFIEVKSKKTAMLGKSGIIEHVTKMEKYIKDSANEETIKNRIIEANKILEQYRKIGLRNIKPKYHFTTLPIKIFVILTNEAAKDFNENNNIYKLLQAKEYKVEINDELKEVYIYKTLT